MENETDQVQVELLGNRLSDSGYAGVKGDRLTVPRKLAEKWCSRGWAKDTAGNIPCGERNTNPVTINPKKSGQSNDSKNIGVTSDA